jgi:hypothetical protein
VYGSGVSLIVEQAVLTVSRAVDRYAFMAPEVKPTLAGVGRFLTWGWWLPVFPLAWLALRAGSVRAQRLWWGAGTVVFLVDVVLAYSRPSALPLLIVPVSAALMLRHVLGVVRPGGAGAAGSAGFVRTEFVALLACTFFAHYYVSRADHSHQIGSTAALVLVLPSLFGSAPPARSSARWALAGFLALLAWTSVWNSRPRWLSTMTGVALVADEQRTTDDVVRIGLAGRSPGSPLETIYPDASENAVSRFVRARTRQDEAVYVGLVDHASPLVNNVRLTWLIGRPLGARHYMLMSGISNSAEAQRQIIEDLERRRVRWVALWRAYAGGRDSLERPLEPGVHELDDYLQRHYRTTTIGGRFHVLEAQN